uniref:Transmembrane protein putative n=1 Tax=Albugo laibachii Nc14 TaxID=890382 RepID=F0X0P1_9STRA|nr:transmembrane protein putative [Albugo laibachii Nc14]|eukprot:CCA27334.1 transmembrane protein putative [Albugo laibachii Nc14]
MNGYDRISDQYGFLYEFRDPCNAASILQLGVFLLSFVVTYPVWWCGIIGIIVSLIGYYGSKQPVVQNKVSFIHFYYFSNYFLLLLELSSLVLLVLLVSKWSAMDGWAWFVIAFGCIALALEFYVTYMAMQRSHAYRAELTRNPPPNVNAYTGTDSL